MKKVLSLIFALLLMVCTMASVAAEISPDPPKPGDEIIIDAIPVPGEGGGTTPNINNPGKVQVNKGETVTLTATPAKGYKFSHWEFTFGEFDIIEGSLTTPVLVIRPTGSGNVRAEAHFVKEDETVAPPSSTPVKPLPTDPTSPITGSDNSAAVTGSVIAIVITMMAIGAVVILKKKLNA